MSFQVNKKQLEYPPHLFIRDNQYRVEVKEFKKKNSSVLVRGDTIEVRLSSNLSFAQKQNHVDGLLKSIAKKIAKSTNKQELSIKEVLKRGYLDCGGKRYFIEKKPGRGVKKIDTTLYVGIESTIEAIEKKIQTILLKDFQNFFEQRVALLNDNSFKFRYRSVGVKILRSKWGHCSYQNDLLFNLKLVNAREEILDYVIYHELAHIKEKNHSRKFWREVERFCPNHRELRKALKDSPPHLYL